MVLNEKYQTAIEEKYRGTPHADIANQLRVPKGTVDDWFRTRGVLSVYYAEFAEELNAKRKERIMDDLKLKDEDVIVLLRKIYIKLCESMDSDNYKPKFMDFVRVWRIQRILQNKPTAIYSRRCPTCTKQFDYYKYR